MVNSDMSMTTMSKRVLSALVLLLIGSASAGPVVLNSGSTQVTLLELYTSQGCSSCPPAERWLNEYVDSDDLWTRTVPIAFHVDYWDYIGWEDIFASPEHGERQRDYARAGRARTVYTPGLFVNGREWRGWTLRLKPRASGKQPGNLSVTVTGDRLTASYPHLTTPLELHIALLGFGIDTRIERGENRNSTLRQEFVVLAHDKQDSSNGHWDIRLPEVEPAQAGRYGVAVWVSAPDEPEPLQATGGWLD
jgi:hypothetical protein